jgi:hypothetical protein
VYRKALSQFDRLYWDFQNHGCPVWADSCAVGNGREVLLVYSVLPLVEIEKGLPSEISGGKPLLRHV